MFSKPLNLPQKFMKFSIKARKKKNFTLLKRLSSFNLYLD